MSTRITPAHLDAKAERVSARAGVTVYVYRAYGGSGVHVLHADTSETDLMGGTHTAREVSRFLDGMSAALYLRTRQELTQ